MREFGGCGGALGSHGARVIPGYILLSPDSIAKMQTTPFGTLAFSTVSGAAGCVGPSTKFPSTLFGAFSPSGLPHSDFGESDCCGLFVPVEQGSAAHITCNECGLVLKSVPIADLRRTLDEMELTLRSGYREVHTLWRSKSVPWIFADAGVYVSRMRTAIGA